MSVVELPDIRTHSNKIHTRQKRTGSDRYQKLGMFQSVDKLIRKGDLQSVIGYDNDYYPKILEDQKKADEGGEIHANLTDLKRSCDNLRSTGLNKERDIDKMRKEIDQMAIIIDSYQKEQVRLKNEEVNLKSKNENQQRLVFEAQYERKVYEHMLDRMKKDQLTYQQRANEYTRHLQQAILKNHSETYKSQQIRELYEKTMMALRDVTSGLMKQNKNREKNIERFKDDLKQRQGIEHKREERVKRQQEIAEVAANSIKDSSIKKWRKLLLVHKFLNTFLKAKMQRGIDQYSHLEEAFQKIKASTGVVDANVIVSKFIGREQTYAHLLISISDYEKKIEGLKTENVDLTSAYKTLRQEYIDMDKEFNVESSKSKEDTEQNKAVAMFEEKAVISTLLSNKLQNWKRRTLKKLGLPENKEFNAILECVREKLLNLSAIQQKELLNKSILSSANDIYDNDFLKRNVRVKPKRLPMTTNQSYEQPSRDEEDLFDEIPLKDDEIDLDEEEDLLRQQREEVKGKKK